MPSQARRLEAMDDVMDVFRRLRALGDIATERRGLSPARAVALMALRDEDLTGVELAKRLNVTPRNVTALVDALEEQGLVHRLPHPLDRRAPLVSLTKAGRAAAAELRAGYERMTDALLGRFSPRDLADLERVTGLLR